MLRTKNSNVIIAAAVLTFGIGILTSVQKRGRLPAFRFFVGNSLLWLALLALDEFEPEIANALSIAIATFVVIGEGGGVLNRYVENRNPTPPTGNPPAPVADTHGGAVIQRRAASPGSPVPIGFVGMRPLFVPGIPPTPGVVHFPYSGN